MSGCRVDALMLAYCAGVPEVHPGPCSKVIAFVQLPVAVSIEHVWFPWIATN